MKSSHLLNIHTSALPADGLGIDGELEASALDIADDDRISAPDPVRLRLQVSPVRGGILAQGTLSTRLRCRCDRCLKYYDRMLAVNDLCHFFKNPVPEEIDLTEYVREDILLGFPQHSLCREDCRGLCPNCGMNLNVRECGCDLRPAPGSVWSALDELQVPPEDQR